MRTDLNSLTMVSKYVYQNQHFKIFLNFEWRQMTNFADFS